MSVPLEVMLVQELKETLLGVSIVVLFVVHLALVEYYASEIDTPFLYLDGRDI